MFLFACCIPFEPPQSDNSLYGIGASFQALSLDHHDNSKPMHHQGSTSSWLHELHRLELLGRNHTPPPVAMNTKNKPLLAPSRFTVGHLSQVQDSAKYKTANIPNKCRRHYYIITLLSFVSLISIVTNVWLAYWIITS